MIVAGVIGSKNNNIISKSIGSILSDKALKYSAIELCSFIEEGERALSSYLKELSKNDFDLAIIYIQEDFANFRKPINIEFDILLFCMHDKNIHLIESNMGLYSNIIDHLNNSGSIIINSDFMIGSKLFEGKALHLVTYGFNSKASITASSVGDSLAEDFFLCSLQRPIIDITKRVLEPQEYKLKRTNVNAGDYEMLAIIAFGIVLGIDF